MRAAIYCRLSFNPDGTALGLDTQEQDGRRYAERLGADSVTVYTDDDISAADPDKHRPGFEALVEGILAGDHDIIVARDQARYSRNPLTLRRLIVACATSGAELHTLNGRIDVDSPEGKAVSQVVGVFDELYVEKIRQLTRRNMAERAAKGLPLSGTAGFGYAKDPAADNYVVVEDEAAEIKRAAERVLAGEPIAAVARDWNERGVTNRRGGNWSPSSVRRVLLAPRTAGLRTHQGKVVGPAAWPAILDEVTYKRVGRVLTDPRRRVEGSRQAKLLTGIVECGGCGNTLNHRTTHGADKYYCRHCHARTVRADALEDYVAGLAVAFFDEPAVLAAHNPAPDMGPVLVELDDVKARKAELAAMYGAGDLDPDEWTAARAALSARERALRTQLDASRPEPLLALYVGRGDLLVDAWPDMPMAGKKRLLRAVFRWVRLGPAVQGLGRFDPGRVTFEYAV